MVPFVVLITKSPDEGPVWLNATDFNTAPEMVCVNVQVTPSGLVLTPVPPTATNTPNAEAHTTLLSVDVPDVPDVVNDIPSSVLRRTDPFSPTVTTTEEDAATEFGLPIDDACVVHVVPFVLRIALVPPTATKAVPVHTISVGLDVIGEVR